MPYTLNRKPSSVDPYTLNPKPLNPKPLNPKPYTLQGGLEIGLQVYELQQPNPSQPHDGAVPHPLTIP